MDKRFEQFDRHGSNKQFELLKFLIHFYLWSFLGVLIVFWVSGRLFTQLAYLTCLRERFTHLKYLLDVAARIE